MTKRTRTWLVCICRSTGCGSLSLTVQVPNNHILTQKPVLKSILLKTQVPNYWVLGPSGFWPVRIIRAMLFFCMQDRCGDSCGLDGLCLPWGSGHVSKFGPLDTQNSNCSLFMFREMPISLTSFHFLFHHPYTTPIYYSSFHFFSILPIQPQDNHPLPWTEVDDVEEVADPGSAETISELFPDGLPHKKA